MASTIWDLVNMVGQCTGESGGGALGEAIEAVLDIGNLLVAPVSDSCADAFSLLVEAIYRARFVGSMDPNDKIGPRGAVAGHYLSGDEPLRYAVFFENVESATAPAQETVITDRLDIARMDLSTFSLGPITFGNMSVNPPSGLSQYATDVDLRPANNLIVRINAGLDMATGLATWRFISLDPATKLPTEDPLAGFLPPNHTPPEGQGSVLFTVKPKQDLPTGTEIRNQATIVFDVNAPINTPEWFNTLDITKPSSQVLSLAPTQTSTSFEVQWSGTDTGSGILDYTIFVSENGGPFTPFISNTTATSATFTGQPGQIYAFFSLARDQVGNREDAKTAPEATTQVIGDTVPPTTTASTSPPPNADGWHNTNVMVTLTAVDNPGGTGVKDLTFTLSGAETGGSVVAGSSAAVMISTEGSTTLTYFARDNAGNQEPSKTLTIQIDKTPPVIAGLPAPGCTLWPPNHKLVQVATVTASDGLSGVVPGSLALTGTSNEPESGLGDGDLAPDVISTGGTVQLRAERAGTGTGRIYTLTATASDLAGNPAQATATCLVPHDQRK